jgi:hypothetical protein
MQNDKGMPKGTGTSEQYKRLRILSQCIVSQHINNLLQLFQTRQRTYHVIDLQWLYYTPLKYMERRDQQHVAYPKSAQ